MEKTIMVKSEVQANGDIFLYYVDENGTPIENEDGMVTTMVQDQFQQLQENYILEEIPIEHETVQNYQEVHEIVENSVEIVENNEEASVDIASLKDQWTDQEIRKLLVFYVDNKKAFLNGSFTKRHLWSVACQMTLTGKNAAICQIQLHNLKMKYEYLQLEYIKNKTDPTDWPYYELCHQAFHDDEDSFKVEAHDKPHRVQNVVRQSQYAPVVKVQEKQASGIFKKFKKTPDEKVKQMLEMYLQSKKEFNKKLGSQKTVWERIALQLGETADYVHKKFLNFKRHYICMLEKRNAGGEVDWPYMALFEAIFKDDADFQRKYGLPKPASQPVPHTTNNAKKILPMSNAANVVVFNLNDWNETEKTVLVKYYYDGFDEFKDPTVPKAFLWTEVGRLLDKRPEDCKNKYEELKNYHLSQYIQKNYNIQTRKPVAIMFDNIIAREVEAQFYDPAYQAIVTDLMWKTEKIDELVQFFLDNIELFKDPICHFVCWSAVAVNLVETVKACKDVWNDLTSLYKSILDDKKEDPDLQIDWRYIEIFDKIFDYGLDTKLLEGYENKVPVLTRQKRVVLGKQAKVEDVAEALSDVEALDIDEESTDNLTDPRAVQILEYYMKNKDKFSTTQKKKNKLWDALSHNIQMSSAECAAKFKSLKKLYMAHIKKEISNPEMPVLWPYYALCKRVFGCRAIRNKLKNHKRDTDDKDEWAPKEIKMLINFAGKNLNAIEADPYSTTIWGTVGKDVCKSDTACREMFLQLKKSYRQIKTMMTTNPDCKVNWKYFKLFEDIYNEAPESMDVDAENLATETKEIPDDEFQCIIVIPEGQDITDLENAQIVVKDTSIGQVEEKCSEFRVLWTKREKNALLAALHEYVTANEEKLINTKDLWETMSKTTNRSPMSCSRMYTNLKKQYVKLKMEGSKKRKVLKSPIFSMIEKILKAKPKFVRPPFTDDDIVLKEQATYTDCSAPLWSVEKALTYYLEHVEEFVDPKYDKKHAWIGLAKAASMRVSKVFKKINYLKQFYNSETNEVDGKPFEFSNTLKEMIEKEFICKIAIGDVADPLSANENTDEVIWTDSETEQLLRWYLQNLEMFKNPKYNQNYLWLEVPSVLNKSPLACSRKMAEIRSQYSYMVKENPNALNDWKYYELCQNIYGTGKKGTEQ